MNLKDNPARLNALDANAQDKPAADDGEVGLPDLSVREGCAERRQRRPRLGDHDQAACWPIQSVHLHATEALPAVVKEAGHPFGGMLPGSPHL